MRKTFSKKKLVRVILVLGIILSITFIHFQLSLLGLTSTRENSKNAVLDFEKTITMIYNETQPTINNFNDVNSGGNRNATYLAAKKSRQDISQENTKIKNIKIPIRLPVKIRENLTSSQMYYQFKYLDIADALEQPANRTQTNNQNEEDGKIIKSLNNAKDDSQTARNYLNEAKSAAGITSN